LLVGVLLALPLLASDEPKGYNDPALAIGLEGAWRLVHVTKDGQEVPTEGLGLIFRGQRFEWTGSALDPSGTYRIDTGRGHLDLLGPDGNNECLFRLDGDVLVIAFRSDTNNRPQGFAEKNTYVETFRRVK
jgi:uncharacterized protein (TIGR03067 family)